MAAKPEGYSEPWMVVVPPVQHWKSAPADIDDETRERYYPRNGLRRTQGTIWGSERELLLHTACVFPDEALRTTSRVAACVNALAGCADPYAALEAARAFLGELTALTGCDKATAAKARTVLAQLGYATARKGEVK